MTDVEDVGLDYLSTLHGVGPKALRLLREAIERGERGSEPGDLG